MPQPRALTLLLLTVAALCAHSQAIRQLPTQELLPVPNLHCIFQDSEGFFWYGTAGGGLCRDNGYQVNVFRTDAQHPGLIAQNDVFCIAEDKNGNIWFGTTSGTYCLDKSTYTIAQIEGHTTATGSLLLDSQGNMWVNDQQAIRAYQPDGSLLFRQDMGETGSLYEDSHGNIWFSAFHNKIWMRQPEGKSFEQQPWESNIQPYHMVEAASEEGFWVSTEGRGIVFYRPQTGEIIPQPATQGQRDKMRILSLLKDRRDGSLWASTYDNLYVYQPHGTQLTLLPQEQWASSGIPLHSGYKLIDRLFQDNEGNIYVAGFYPCTFIITNDETHIRRWSDILHFNDGTPDCPIFADAAAADGNLLWVSHTRHGLLLYDKAGTLLWQGGTRLNQPIADSQNEGIWAINDRKTVVHLRYLGNGQMEERGQTGIPHHIVRFTAAPDGSLLLGSTLGIYRHEPTTYTTTLLYESERLTRALIGTHDGSIFFTINGEGAPLRISPSGGEAQRVGGLQPAEQVTHFAEAPDGTLWAATDFGNIYTLAPSAEAFEINPYLSELQGNPILDLHVDRSGHVWKLTHSRLYEVNPFTHALRCYRNDDPSINLSFFAHLDAADATHVLLSGAGAVCQLATDDQIDLHATTTDSLHTRPLLTAVSIGEDVHLIPQGETSVSVPAEGGTVVLIVSTLQGINAQRVSFAYQTNDMDEQWQYLPKGDNRIYLGTLSAGTHHVRVKATDVNGRWQDSITTLTLRRQLLWWQTPWAIAAVILIALALILVLTTISGRIHHLRSLIRLRNRLSISQIEIQPAHISEAQQQEALLRKARDLVIQHLADPDYDIDTFARDLCMSRMKLYRTLTSLTGLPPGEFIRDIRLKQAAQLLTTYPDLSVAEVATKTGFSSASYFTKCFKIKFKQLPTAYRTSQTE